MATDPTELVNQVQNSEPSRPYRDLAGQTTINVPESALTSIDSVLDWAGLPELGPIVHRLAPRNVADAAGVPTPDQVTDQVMRDLDDRFNVRFPPER